MLCTVVTCKIMLLDIEVIYINFQRIYSWNGILLRSILFVRYSFHIRVGSITRTRPHNEKNSKLVSSRTIALLTLFQRATRYCVVKNMNLPLLKNFKKSWRNVLSLLTITNYHEHVTLRQQSDICQCLLSSMTGTLKCKAFNTQFWWVNIVHTSTN